MYSKIIFLLLLVFSLCGCGYNILSNTSNKETDEALFHDAQVLVDDSQFLLALDKFALMSDSFKTQYDVRKVYIGALAGQCGLKFLSFFDTISNGDSSSTTLFQFFMSAFVDKTVAPSYCALAEREVISIGATAALRSSDDNLFMAILMMAKLGAYVRDNADRDGTNSLGDGTVDAGFNACDSSAPAFGQDYFEDDEIKEIVVGFGLLLENITSVGSGGTTDAVSQFQDACNLIEAGTGNNPCGRTAVADVTTDDVAAFRDILSTSDVGIGTCTDPLVVTCCP